MSERARLLLELADDELILGWRESEWTGIAPIARGGRRVLVDRAERDRPRARRSTSSPRAELGDDADALAFDREPGRVPLRAARRAAPARVGARRSRAAGCTRWPTRCGSTALKALEDAAVAGLAAKIDREEAYHRMHAEMWHERLRDEPRFRAAVERAVAVRARRAPGRAARASRGAAARPPSDSCRSPIARNAHPDELAELWDEMTMRAPLGAGGRSGDGRAGLGRRSTRCRTRRSRSSRSSTSASSARSPSRATRAGRVHADVPRLPRARVHARAIEEKVARARRRAARSRSSPTTRGRPTGSPPRAARSFARRASRRRRRARRRAEAPPAPVERSSAAPTAARRETRLENIFGPTPCRSLRYCESCRQPFEQFKTI